MQHTAHLSRCLTRPHHHIRTKFVHKSYNASRSLLTLAIETSCDDTCVAILETKSHSSKTYDIEHERSSKTSFGQNDMASSMARLHFNEKVTAKNTGLGGIHPLEALESHRANLAHLVNKSLSSLPLSDGKADERGGQVCCSHGIARRKPDFISVTRGPGMRSNLLCGLEMAKGLAVGWQVPIIGVHHMQSHALTPRFVQALSNANSSADLEPQFPFLTLLVSGGHTMLLYSTALTEHRILASTGDVAIGDALDKCGRLLLPDDIKANAPDTAFGKYLSKYAFPDAKSFKDWPVPRRRKDEIDKPLNRYGWQIQTPHSMTREMSFSFASLESRAAAILKERENVLHEPVAPDERALLAQTLIGNAFEHLGSRVVIALENLRKQGVTLQSLVVSGGVAANDFLRHYLQAILTERGFECVNLLFPPVEYCTDNAAMIAWAGLEMYKAGYSSDLSIDALRKWSMDATVDGGILGVNGWQRSSGFE